MLEVKLVLNQKNEKSVNNLKLTLYYSSALTILTIPCKLSFWNRQITSTSKTVYKIYPKSIQKKNSHFK